METRPQERKPFEQDFGAYGDPNELRDEIRTLEKEDQNLEENIALILSAGLAVCGFLWAGVSTGNWAGAVGVAMGIAFVSLFITVPFCGPLFAFLFRVIPGSRWHPQYLQQLELKLKQLEYYERIQVAKKNAKPKPKIAKKQPTKHAAAIKGASNNTKHSEVKETCPAASSTGLTQSQLNFLSDHNLPLSCTFDATGLKTGEYQFRMKELDKLVAYGVTPCKKSNHRLRNPSGHCIQCNPASIAFITRFHTDGCVYVLTSQKAEAIKVGFSLNTSERVKHLNAKGYGGVSDWRLFYEANAPEAGRLEHEVHSSLSKYKKELQHYEWNKLVICQETFSCSAEFAVDELKEISEALEASPDKSPPPDGQEHEAILEERLKTSAHNPDVPATANANIEQRLTVLKYLFDKRLISHSDYDEKKQSIMEDL